MTLWLEGYQDICNELELIKIYENDLRKRVEMAHKVVVSGEMQSDAHYVHIPLDKSLDQYKKVVDKYREVVDRVNELTDVKVQMELYIEKFEGLTQQVVYKRAIESKSLPLIASELHISYDYVARILSRNKVKIGRKYKSNTKQAV